MTQFSSQKIEVQLADGDNEVAVKRKCWKNALIQSFGYFLVFLSFFSLRNLQSSLNSDNGLGLVSLAGLYAGFCTAGIIASLITERLGAKWTLAGAMGTHVVYVAANFYPSSYTLIPASVLVGFGLTVMWTAQGTYMTEIGNEYSETTKKDSTHVMTKLYAIFFMIWQCSNILGNLVTSLVLSPVASSGENHSHTASDTFLNKTHTIALDSPPDTIVHLNTTGHGQYGMNFSSGLTMKSLSAIDYNGYYKFISNTSSSFEQNELDVHHMCGAKYCHDFVINHPHLHVSQETLFILLGIYLISSLSGVVLVVVFLDKLKTPPKVEKRQINKVKRQLLSLFRHIRNRNAMLMTPMYFYCGMEQAFMFAEVTKAFITCPVGMYMIGYVMICFGVSNALSCVLIGRAVKYVNRAFIILAGGLINLGLLILMIFWLPEPDKTNILMYVIAGGWGIGDAIWHTKTSSLTALLFLDNKEPAYASLSFWKGGGFSLMFAIASYICMETKIYVMIASVTFMLACYFTLEWRIKSTSGNDSDVDEKFERNVDLKAQEALLDAKGAQIQQNNHTRGHTPPGPRRCIVTRTSDLAVVLNGHKPNGAVDV